MTRRITARSLALVTSLAAVALSVPPLRSYIEQSMAWHMAVQMPLLVAGGWWWAQAMAQSRPAQSLAPWNHYGLSGFLAVQAALAYWMLPSAIDRAVVLPEADAVKLVMLLACGAVLRHSIERAPAVIQLFFVGYGLSMMVWLGLYLVSTDLRLCNAYSLQGQINAGWALVAWAVALGTAWLVGALRVRGRAVVP